MQHLNEGTIHAWIDGALDAEQSRDIETHLSRCAPCSAAVAEARGLVAASSRILNALDDVPGDVVPKRFAPPVSKPAARQRRVTPWVSAIAAAALIVAIGLPQVMSKGRLSVNEMADSTTGAGGAELVQRLGDSALAPAAPAPPAVAQARVTAGGVAEQARAANQQAPLRRSAGLSDASAQRDARAEIGSVAAAAGAGAGERARLAKAPPGAPSPVADLAADAKVEAVAMKSAAEPTAPAAMSDTTRRRPDSLRIALGPFTLPATLPGCYRTATELPESRVSKAGNLAGAVSRAAAESRTAARAAAPSAVAQSDFAAQVVPEIVRLDTVPSSPGFAVRGARSDSVIGWWSRLGQDTASVRLLPGVVLKLTVANRVSCPER